MLTFFPTPYPDEWWYSVLCRYYVRSGWVETAACLRELYGKRSMNHGTHFPNIDCYATIENIPPGIFSLKDILLEHTLMPYYLRFYSPEKKREILGDFLFGKSIPLSRQRIKTMEGKQGLKFCPLCYAEDTEIYGEPYWHREHQIPLISMCPKHKIRLCFVNGSIQSLTSTLLPLCKLSNHTNIIQTNNYFAWEPLLTEALVSILTLPFELSPPVGYNNLKNVLWSKGYGSHIINNRQSLGAECLRKECIEFYGKDISEECFLRFTNRNIHRVCTWKAVSPEQYALLSVFAGLSVQELFGKEIHAEDPILKELLKYKNKGYICNKDELAKSVGISSTQLDALVKKYGITPFWTQRRKARRPETLRLRLTVEEKQKVFAAASALGNGPISAFARAILLEEARQILDEQNKEDQNEI